VRAGQTGPVREQDLPRSDNVVSDTRQNPAWQLQEAEPQTRLAEARERFLTSAEVAPDEVRDAILTSWLRSRIWKVNADQIALPYIKDPDRETLLAHTSAPILAQLHEELRTEPVSIILTDAKGVVLQRLTGDPELERYLDRVQLAPGFSYSERSVGTNGIGSALESREPFQVIGHEHYAENLETLACAGVPICNPTSGRLLGLLDLTSWTRHAGPLLVALAKATSQRIEKSLLEQTGLRELALFREYRRTCQRTSGPVLAINDDVAMMNESARRLLDAADQTMLLGYAADAIDVDGRTAAQLALPSGAEARVSCKPAWTETGLAGSVVHVRFNDAPTPQPVRSRTPARAALPGLVGSSSLWKRCCVDLDRHYRSGDRFVVEGEPGTGKLALLRAVHQSRQSAAHFRVMDAADCVNPQAWTQMIAQELEAGEGALVLRHLDQLSRPGLRALAHVLETTLGTTTPPLLAATVQSLASPHEDLARVLSHFPRSVGVPPLRHHVDDVRELVPFLLGRITRSDTLTCSPEAMQVLLRNAWPGNVAELNQTLFEIVQRRRSGTIRVGDLPPSCRTTNRRILSPLEAMQRDAIIRSLQSAAANKKQAAEALGISRATIYRKIREYGIDTTPDA
jgi:transcriptional regulator of acetoin/glycerol metabolism